jgi:hypothetical protein
MDNKYQYAVDLIDDEDEEDEDDDEHFVVGASRHIIMGTSMISNDDVVWTHVLTIESDERQMWLKRQPQPIVSSLYREIGVEVDVAEMIQLLETYVPFNEQNKKLLNQVKRAAKRDLVIKVNDMSTDRHKIQYLKPLVGMSSYEPSVSRLLDAAMKAEATSMFHHAKARIIQSHFRQAIGNPHTIVCQSRLHGEWNEMVHA